MKTTMKFFLLVTLFCGTALAGDMGPAGFAPGDMGPGGRAGVPEDPNTTKTSDTIVTIFAKYIVTILV